MALYNQPLDENVLNRFLALDQGGKIQVSKRSEAEISSAVVFLNSLHVFLPSLHSSCPALTSPSPVIQSFTPPLLSPSYN
jgi:hypothetical protein